MSDDTPPERRRITIPEETAEAIGDRLDRTAFETVDEYTSYALARLLHDLEDRDREVDPTSERDALDRSGVAAGADGEAADSATDADGSPTAAGAGQDRRDRNDEDAREQEGTPERGERGDGDREQEAIRDRLGALGYL